MSVTPLNPRSSVTGPRRAAHVLVLSREALSFLEQLARFIPRIQALLAERKARQVELDAGTRLEFLAETRSIRESDWSIDPLPAELSARRVEISGPTEPKAMIDALNSGADVFTADLEDATAPTWDNVIGGQLNLRDAVAGTLNHIANGTGKSSALEEKTALLCVRPRALHQVEQHLRIDGAPMPAALVDFGLFFFHNVRPLLAQGTRVFLALAKLESRLEARLWNDIFVFSEEALGVPHGTIRATAIIETLPAAFEMDEILFELRTHAAGLGFGRLNYLASFIQQHSADAAGLMPDLAQVNGDQPFLSACAQQLIDTCHRRAAPAMGELSTRAPVKGDPAASEAGRETVRACLKLQAAQGFDGTGVAHPALVPVARELFFGSNQLPRHADPVTAQALLAAPSGTRTEAGLRQSLRVGVQVLEAWLCGEGRIALEDHLHDVAAAELARAQLWQWIRHGAVLADGRTVDAPLFRALMAEELLRLEKQQGAHRSTRCRLALAAGLFDRLVTSARFDGALTRPGYELLLAATEQAA
jgi:malate synthase